jgi:hypothetical protein
MKNGLREFSIGEKLKALDAANLEAGWRSRATRKFSLWKIKASIFSCKFPGK